VSLSGRGMDRKTPRWRRPAEASKGEGRSATGAVGARAPCAAATLVGGAPTAAGSASLAGAAPRGAAGVGGVGGARSWVHMTII